MASGQVCEDDAGSHKLSTSGCINSKHRWRTYEVMDMNNGLGSTQNQLNGDSQSRRGGEKN